MATILFNIRQGHSESLKKYLTNFIKATIWVLNPCQKMFVGAFQNGLKV